MNDINYKEAKLFGFMLGDGWVSKLHDKNHYNCGFSGDRLSLQNAKNDLISIYGDIGKAFINTRKTKSPAYGIYGTTSYFVVNKKVCDRFIELGMPIGKKVEVDYEIPDTIKSGSIEIKKGFLSGLYAAEGYTPAMQKNDKTPKVLGINLTKRLFKYDNFTIFLNQLFDIFDELGIAYSYKTIETFTCDNNAKAIITFSNELENIIRLGEILDLSYCIEKQVKMENLYKYSLEKKKCLDNLQEAYNEAIYTKNTAKNISVKYNITQSQVENWRRRRTGIRIPNTFPTLSSFIYC